LAKQDLSAALETVQQAADLTPADKQDSDPEWQQILALRARIELAQRNYAAAAADAQLALERAQREAIDPKSSAWVGEALVLRAQSESAGGNSAAASASARQALPHLLENLDPAHPLIAEADKLASGT
jgi:tetratricopeptide (TPR) repeat protein